MTYGSLFSGAGGFDLGFDAAGLSCRWQCEIDPQASKVLARHWPGVARFSDIRTVRNKGLAPVDVVVGGFPCQDLSVAGKRKGLSGERSGLFYELLRVVRLCRPRFVVWENVPGLLSSDDGRDFGRVLRGLADVGYFGAWRVLDARFFGVPQRRRRVFGVFARGRAGAVGCGQILALTQGVRGNSQTGSEAGEDLAGTLTGGARKHGGYSARDESGLVAVARCLTARNTRIDAESENLISFTAKDHGADAGELSPTLRAGGFKDSHQNGGVMPAVAYLLNVANRKNGGSVTDTAGTVDTGGLNPNTNQDGMAVCIPIDMRQASRGATMTNNRKEGSSGGAPGTGIGEPSDPSPSLSLSHPPAVVFQTRGSNIGVGDISGTLGTNSDRASGSAPMVFNWQSGGDCRGLEMSGTSQPLTCEQTPAVLTAGVRRLTPRECERLMSWPDDHTRWDADGNEFADGPRYRMCGNGVVANVAQWLGRRIKAGK